MQKKAEENLSRMDGFYKPDQQSELPQQATSPSEEAMSERRTLDATRKCAEWLAACIEIGWSKSSLDFLESLWWQHHDHRGNLITTTAFSSGAAPSLRPQILEIAGLVNGYHNGPVQSSEETLRAIANVLGEALLASQETP